jgi:PAS domain S-box-containing protein
MTWRTDDHAICTDVSETWSSQVGRGVAALRGDGWLQIIHPEDRERIRAETGTLRATQQTYIQCYRVRCADGTDVHVRVRVSHAHRRDDGAGYVHVVTVCHPTVRFGQPLLASIVRPPPPIVAPATQAEDEDARPRVAAAVE